MKCVVANAGEMSPASFVLQELVNAKFAVRLVELDLREFHCVARKRHRTSVNKGQCLANRVGKLT